MFLAKFDCNLLIVLCFKVGCWKNILLSLVKHNKYKYSEACRLNVFKQDVIEVLLCWLLLSAKNNQLFCGIVGFGVAAHFTFCCLRVPLIFQKRITIEHQRIIFLINGNCTNHHLWNRVRKTAVGKTFQLA